MQQRQPPQPKGDIAQLWKLLGVDFGGDNVVWQDYNPLSEAGRLMPREWVFVDNGSGATPAVQHQRARSPSKLQQVLFLFPGAVTGLNSSPLKFTELVSTSDRTGTVRYDQIMERSFMGQPRMNPEMPLLEKPTNDKYVLAAQINGKLKTENMPMSDKAGRSADEPEAGQGRASDEGRRNRPTRTTPKKPTDKPLTQRPAEAAEAAKAEPEINVVLVGDIDCLYGAFFALAGPGRRSGRRVRFPFRQRAVRAQRARRRWPATSGLSRSARGGRRIATLTRGQRRHGKGPRSSRRGAARSSSRSSRQSAAKAQKEFDDQIAELKKRKGGQLSSRPRSKSCTRSRPASGKLDIKIEQLKQRARPRNQEDRARAGAGSSQGAGQLQAVGRAAAADSAVDRGLASCSSTAGPASARAFRRPGCASEDDQPLRAGS